MLLPPAAYARAALLGALAALLVLPLLVSLGGPAAAASPRTPSPGERAPQSASLQPMVQTDGIVYSVEIVGNQVWAVGDFDTARPAGVPRGGPGEVPRKGLVVADVRTGEILPIAHTMTGTVFTSATNPGKYCSSVGPQQWLCDALFRVVASPDGSRVYVGGDITGVDGQSRQRVAAFDTATGALVPGFRPSFDGRVRALAVTADRVYVGGGFASVDGVPRERLAAVSSTGQVLPFAPGADRTVWAAAASTTGDRVVVGGQFDVLAGQPRRALGAVLADGTPAPWAADLTGFPGSWVTDVDVAGDRFYAGANGEASPQLDGRIAGTVATGARLWTDACKGATQSVAVDGGQLYSASHAHDCAAMDSFPERNPRYYQRILAEPLDATVTSRYGQQVPRLSHWFPNTDDGPATSPFLNGPWAIDAAAGTVVVGGEFLEVNGVPQEGLARFVPRTPATAKSGPEFPFVAPRVSTTVGGQVRVAFQPTWDRDDPTLTYTLLRDERALADIPVTSGFWDGSQEDQVYVDRDVAPGSTHTYRLRVRDGDGNSLGGPAAAPVTVAPDARGPFVTAAHEAGATHVWRLGGGPADAVRDLVGGLDLVASSGVTTGVPGALSGPQQDGAVRTDGTTAGQLVTAATEQTSQAATVSVWFRTTDPGGALVARSNRESGTTSGDSDQALFLRDGRVVFGVDNRNFGSPVDWPRVTTPGRYDDGAWHQAVATAGDHGLEVYVDGELAAADRTAAHSRYPARWWRVGATRLSAFGQGDGALAADLDEVAVYERVLTPDQVRGVYAAGRSLVAPTAAATATCQDLTCTFDASGSTDDGPAAALTYAWDLGDGTTATGVAPSRTYGTGGPRTATVTVTDADGLSSTATVDVSPRAPSVFAARDSFDDRTRSRGFGVAQHGGPWSVRYSDGDFSVTDGTGVITLPRSGRLRTAWLPDVSAPSTSLSTKVGLSRLPQGSSQLYVWAVARQVELDRDYRARVRVFSDGSVRLALARRPGTSVDQTLGAEVAVPGLVAVPGTALRVRVEAVGASPTQLRARVWADGTPEPDVWQVEATDATPALQAPGGVAVAGYLTGSETTPLRLAVDDVAAVDPAVRPVAAFTGSCTGRTCTMDASATTAGDGSRLDYSWDLGDGTTATGVNPARLYAADGTYRVVLTVTTEAGQVDQTVGSVTTQTSTVASDDFGRTVGSGLGLAPLGGPYTLRYSAGSFSVADGAAVIDLPSPGRYRDAVLRGATATDVDLAASFSTDRLPVAGAETYVWGLVRSTATDVDYRVRLRIAPDGSTLLALVRRDGGGNDVTLASTAVPGLVVTPGQQVRLRVQAVGTSPTQLRARAWTVGTPEPTGWQVTATDATPALQGPGGVGFAAYRTGNGEASPLRVRVDDLLAAPPA